MHWVVELVLIVLFIYTLCDQLKGHALPWYHGQQPRECPVCGKKTALIIKSRAFDMFGEEQDVLKCFSGKCKSMVKNWQGYETTKEVLDENNQVKCVDLLEKRKTDLELKAKQAEKKLQMAIDRIHKASTKQEEIEKKGSDENVQSDTVEGEPEYPEYAGVPEHLQYADPCYTEEDRDLIDRVINSISDDELVEIAEALEERSDRY